MIKKLVTVTAALALAIPSAAWASNKGGYRTGVPRAVEMGAPFFTCNNEMQASSFGVPMVKVPCFY